MILKKKPAKTLLVVLGVLLALTAACGLYVADYYPADTTSIAAFAEDICISRQVLQKNALAYIPEHPEAGLIFYPGGKVEHSAYEPLMLACAQRGILCILMKMPGNLAVLDADAADGIPEQFPGILNWYIGGHSLGGSMAASYAADHTDLYRGLILLASYSTADLSAALDVLSLYGSEDQVLNLEKYHLYRSNLPADRIEIMIDGGNHAGFGMYGAQSGDGTASITNAEQITVSAGYIAEFIRFHNREF